MNNMKQLKDYQVKSNWEWIDKSIEGVTGQNRMTRRLHKLTPLFYTLALANRGIDIATKKLRTSGLLK